MPITHETDSKEPTLDERRRAAVQRCLHALMKENPEYYYEPASEVARALQLTMRRTGLLDRSEREAVQSLKVRDIEILLAYK